MTKYRSFCKLLGVQQGPNLTKPQLEKWQTSVSTSAMKEQGTMEQKTRRMRGIAVVSLDYGQAKATGPMHSIGQRLFIDSKRSSTPLL